MIRYPLALATLLLSLLFSLTVQAAPERSPDELIRHSVETLTGQIEGRRDHFANNMDELEALVDDSLDEIADFRYIGASVMGRYFANATPQQRSRFVETFRQTLIDTYAKGLVTFDYRELRVLDAQRAQRHRSIHGAPGEDGPLQGSGDEGRGVNVSVNGINLGLTFRNQFDQAMRDNARDYDAVIDGWSPEVGVEELEQGA